MRKIPPPYTDPSPLFRHGGGPPGLLDFSASINPLGTPKSVMRAVQEGLADIGRYPDPTCQELTVRIAAEHQVEPTQIVVGNGSNELIYAVARALLPERAAVLEPTYTEYLRASLLVGAKVDHWLTKGITFRFQAFDPQRAQLVWLCHPNNPTGDMWASAEHLAHWIAAHPDTFFAVDEAFLPYRPVSRWYPASLLGHLGRLPNLIVVRSLTKFFALPGLRLGYTVSHPGLALRIRSQLPPWSVNTLAQRAGVAALDDEDYWCRTQDWMRSDNPVDFIGQLRDLSPAFQPLVSRAMFVLVRLRGVTSGWLVDRLVQRGIRIRDASNFVGLDDRYVRIAIRSASENNRLMKALAAVLAEESISCPAP